MRSHYWALLAALFFTQALAEPGRAQLQTLTCSALDRAVQSLAEGPVLLASYPA